MSRIPSLEDSYFAVLGLTGAGKSLFLNAISDSNQCEVGSVGKSCTQKNKLITFIYKNHRFNALDTAGLDDSNDNESKIKNLKDILKEQPMIKALIILKKYNDLRLPGSMQDALISFMEAFPLKKFWEHVIIVNTWANPFDETFKDYIDEPHEQFLEKILQCEKLINIMKDKNIDLPHNLKEYYVCSKKIKKYTEIAEQFNKIKDDIKSNILMFKDVKKSDVLERTRESKNKGFYIITKYIKMTCIDWNDRETIIEQITEPEKETVPENCDVISVREEEKDLEQKDEVKWYDIATLGITRAMRKTNLYEIFQIKTYKVGDKKIEGERTHLRYEFR